MHFHQTGYLIAPLNFFLLFYLYYNLYLYSIVCITYLRYFGFILKFGGYSSSYSNTYAAPVEASLVQRYPELTRYLLPSQRLPGVAHSPFPPEYARATECNFTYQPRIMPSSVVHTSNSFVVRMYRFQFVVHQVCHVNNMYA